MNVLFALIPLILFISNASAVDCDELLTSCYKIHFEGAKLSGSDTAGLISCYLAAIHTNSNCSEIWQKLGEEYFYIGDYTNALFALDNAARLDPNNTWCIYRKGKTLYYLNEFKASIKAYELAISKGMNSSDIWFDMRDSYLALNKKGEADTANYTAIKLKNEEDKAYMMSHQLDATTESRDAINQNNMERYIATNITAIMA